MGKWKAFLPILIALIIALIGAFAANRWLKNQALIKGKPTIGETAQIVVAKVDLPWGTKLTPETLTSAKFIKDTLPPGYFIDTAALNNRVLLSPVSKNEPILEARLAPVSITTGGVSAVIPSGKRAIAVKGDKVIGLSGLIQPGNRVDILLSITNPETQTEITKIVLQDMLVLAANTQMEKGKKEGEVAPVDVYTLEVTPEEGEKLALAATQGKLQFALRNPTDLEMVVTRGATIPDTLGMVYIPGNKKSPAPAATRSPSAAPESEVTIINGAKATVVKHAM